MLIGLGFLMIAVFMYLILSKRLTPVVALILVPVVFGIELTPSWANFVLAKFLRGSAFDVARSLERHGVIIRPLTSFGLSSEYARISVGSRLENERLVEALRLVS